MNIAEIEGLLAIAEQALEKAKHDADEIQGEALLERVAELAKSLDATRELLIQKRRTLCQVLITLAYAAGIRALVIPRHRDMLELFSDTYWRIRNSFHGGKRDFSIGELLEYSTEDFAVFCRTTLNAISTRLPSILKDTAENAKMIDGVVSKISELLTPVAEKS